MRLQLDQVAARGSAFFRAPGVDCLREARVGDEVPAAHQRGQETARDLVAALRTGLEASEPLAQAVFDALVVAGLEMQAGVELRGAPITAMQRVPAAQAERAGDRPSIVLDSYIDKSSVEQASTRENEAP